MRERHWVDISDIIGYAFKPSETTTLQASHSPLVTPPCG